MARLDLLTDPATMAPISHTGPSQNRTLPPEPQDHPSTLAIGLELKFLVPFLRADCTDPASGDPRPVEATPHADNPDRLREQAYNLVAGLLRGAGQHVIAISEIKSSESERDYWDEHWIVKKGNSAEALGNERAPGYIFAPLELSSPRFSALDRRTYDLIARVIDCLEAGCRFTVNQTCEVHVHIGRKDGASFSLQSLQNFAALCWLAEPTLRLLKDPRSPNFEHVYTWSSPLREHSRLAAEVAEVSKAGGGRDRFALERIFVTKDDLALGKLMSGTEDQYRRLGFNFSAFGLEDARAVRSPRSVEVRFFEDYRGRAEVLGWVEICVALGIVAVGGTDASWEIRKLMGCEEGRPGERMEVLLKMLRVDEAVVKLFSERVEEIHVRQD